MAQNITLLGASYTAVPAVTLPKTGGGTARFSDASVTTAVESDVAEGKTFLLADGSIGMGTASGGGSSGLVYETGTYTAETDERPEISFINSHSRAPDILIFADASASAPLTGNTLSAYCHFNYQSLFGAALATPTAQSAAYGYGRLALNMNYASGLVSDTTSAVTSGGFEPFAGTNAFTCKSGQTYKWIAVWVPTS